MICDTEAPEEYGVLRRIEALGPYMAKSGPSLEPLPHHSADLEPISGPHRGPSLSGWLCCTHFCLSTCEPNSGWALILNCVGACCAVGLALAFSGPVPCHRQLAWCRGVTAAFAVAVAIAAVTAIMEQPWRL
jgi:hypothetical protein